VRGEHHRKRELLDRPPPLVGEDQAEPRVRAERLDLRGYCLCDVIWQRNGPVRRGRLKRTDENALASDAHQLLFDSHLAFQELDPVECETKGFPWAQLRPAPGRSWQHRELCGS
jgi:hypothetical protein